MTRTVRDTAALLDATHGAGRRRHGHRTAALAALRAGGRRAHGTSAHRRHDVEPQR